MILQNPVEILTLIFGILFWVIGLCRCVEFQILPGSLAKKISFQILHGMGVSLFSLSMIGVGQPLNGSQEEWLRKLFGASLVILFPLHIFLNLNRRILIRKIHSEKAGHP